MVKGDNGKNQVVTDEFSSPLFDPRFIFEMLVNFETLNIGGKGGFVHVWKCTHPGIAPLLPGPQEQVTVAHGAALAAWCAGGAVQTTQTKLQAQEGPKAKLWRMALEYCAPETAVATVEEILIRGKFIGKQLKELTPAEMGEAVAKLEVALSEIVP